MGDNWDDFLLTQSKTLERLSIIAGAFTAQMAEERVWPVNMFTLNILTRGKMFGGFVGTECSQGELPAEGTFSDLNQLEEGGEKEPNDSSCLCPFS